MYTYTCIHEYVIPYLFKKVSLGEFSSDITSRSSCASAVVINNQLVITGNDYLKRKCCLRLSQFLGSIHIHIQDLNFEIGGRCDNGPIYTRHGSSVQTDRPSKRIIRLV